MFRLPDSWVWDFWLADDGDQYHLFFLFASRALHDPDLRHRRASVGHAVSSDLVNWERLEDALVAGEAPAFDAVATWTGSVTRAPSGQWHMYYTGVHDEPEGFVQQIGLATSDDLMSWAKHPASPLVVSDSRWYETLADNDWVDESWRDPWVFADPDGDGWHMLITARSNSGARLDRGTIGHATSQDLLNWEVKPPVSLPGGFGQLEVTQVEVIDGQVVLLFSCLTTEISPDRADGGTGGVWAVAAPSLLGPFDLSRAVLITDDTLYSGRLVKDRSGRWVMLAFHAASAAGFVGEICDPIPLTDLPWQRVLESSGPNKVESRPLG